MTGCGNWKFYSGASGRPRPTEKRRAGSPRPSRALQAQSRIQRRGQAPALQSIAAHRKRAATCGRPYKKSGARPRIRPQGKAWQAHNVRPYGIQQTVPGADGRGTPQGGFSCPCGAIHLQPLPYESQENPPCLGRGAPWGSRRGQAKRSPSSAPFGGIFPLGGGRLRARQDSHRERWLRKPRRMSGTAPAAIFANPGPSGPEGSAEATPFLRAGNSATSNKRASPVMGDRG